MRSTTTYRGIAFVLIVSFVFSVLAVTGTDAFARSGGVKFSYSSDRAQTSVSHGDARITQFSNNEGPLTDANNKDDECNWFCRLLKKIRLVLKIAMDVLDLICTYAPQYCPW